MSDLNPYPILSKPPLKEAIVDIRVSLDIESVPIEALKLQADLIELANLDEGSPMMEFGMTMGLDASTVPERIQQLVGFEYRSLDKKLVIRLHPGGCSIHQLEGYTNWSSLSRIARLVWDQFDCQTGSKRLVRLGLRYVNIFQLPSPLIVSDYFNFFLVCPENLPYQWGPQFQSNFSIYDNARRLNCLVNLAHFASADNESTFDAYFDIDVSKNTEIETQNLWQTFEGLRSFKNEIFFKGLSQSLLERLI